MTYLIENWFLFIALAALFGGIGATAYYFAGVPRKKQIETIKKWLLFACIEAEKELGDGTGQLKLRYVYNLFITRFPSVAKIVPFTVFSLWVDAALEEMRTMLTQNKAIREVVKGEKV
ncbi:hypothetical protein [Anaerotignum sp. MB30-C6]|uniref:hypothetical protein n=1 Tax=Anaerotignum sp. MB30-C6 TaxID=3070814 RepID=UPI0027DAEA93|nr:hypothetical protein [Anaerotignum sp. MB30-C6]WMI80340.1 hypothetical protein RBQ60_10880 [Anaerotignum sp. MB30-C6]